MKHHDASYMAALVFTALVPLHLPAGAELPIKYQLCIDAAKALETSLSVLKQGTAAAANETIRRAELPLMHTTELKAQVAYYDGTHKSLLDPQTISRLSQDYFQNCIRR